MGKKAFGGGWFQSTCHTSPLLKKKTLTEALAQPPTGLNQGSHPSEQMWGLGFECCHALVADIGSGTQCSRFTGARESVPLSHVGGYY